MGDFSGSAILKLKYENVPLKSFDAFEDMQHTEHIDGSPLLVTCSRRVKSAWGSRLWAGSK